MSAPRRQSARTRQRRPEAGGEPEGGHPMPSTPAAAQPRRRGRNSERAPRRNAARGRVASGGSAEGATSRRERALHDTLFLLERTSDGTFDVMGRSGNVYGVSILGDGTFTCSCPDARFRCQRLHLHCKHVLFVVLRVLGGSTDDLATPRGVSRLLAKDVRRATVASHDVEARYAALIRGETVPEVPRRQPTAEDVCAICYEDLVDTLPDGAGGGGGGATASPELAFCRYGCGHAVHASCFTHWATARRRAGDDVTCVYCRSHWDPPKPQRGHLGRGQYVNLLDGGTAKRPRVG